jgi:hypothetical protein
LGEYTIKPGKEEEEKVDKVIFALSFLSFNVDQRK